MNCEKIVNKVNKANRINSIHRVYKETSKLINPEQQTELPSADYPTPAQAVAREVGNLKPGSAPIRTTGFEVQRYEK